jgi:hypothetical protein
MTISAGYTPDSYDGDGIATQFAVTFPFFEEDELEVILLVDATGLEYPQLLNTDYTVTGGAQGLAIPTTGQVEMTVKPAVGETLIIRRTTDREQQIDFTRGGPLAPNSLEGGLDRATMINQEDEEAKNRSLRFPKSDDPSLDAELPGSLNRISTVLGFNASSEPICITGSIDSTLVAVTAVGTNIVGFNTIAEVIDYLSLFTTRGDILTAGVAGIEQRLELGADDTVLRSDGTDALWAQTPLPRGYLAGGNLSPDVVPTTDILIGPVACRDSLNAGSIIDAGMVKEINAIWEAGTNNGGMPNGLLAADTWYHVFAIRNPTTGAVDFGFDTSLTAVNLIVDHTGSGGGDASGFTQYRRLGSILVDAGSQIEPFTQVGDEFLWDDAVTGDIFDTTAIAASRQAVALTVPPDVVVWALFHANLMDTAVDRVFFSSLDETDADPTDADGTVSLFTAGSGLGAAGKFAIRTNTSRQIGYRGHTGGGDLYAATVGWIDSRGRND